MKRFATCLQARVACTVDAQMCWAVKNVACPRPQAVVAIDGQYVELVEEIRPTGKKTVKSERHTQRRSKDGLWHGTLAAAPRHLEY
jgi:hypothetical protein